MGDTHQYDVVVVGAGVAGLYLLHRLRGLGFSAVALDTAADVGGTWYWNRYPGARCDVPSLDYSFSFDPELEQEWEWSERYATQPEILRYLNHVTERFDLRRDIRFETRVDAAAWDDEASRWNITTTSPDGTPGDRYQAQWYVMATGCLSVPKDVDIAGVDRFAGPTYLTGRWPHEGVDFTGQRVAVIGTGSSGIQSIPLIAAEAEHLTVYQRTANFSLPAGNGPVSPERLAVKDNYREYRQEARESRTGMPFEETMESFAMLSEEERQARLEERWNFGHIVYYGSAYADYLISDEANEYAAEFARNKIRGIVEDPEIAELLCPKGYPISTKRLCLDTGYYDTFNRPNVDLVDLRADPITTITETGIETEGGEREFDAIVLATGFDAMTGAIVGVDIKGRDGVSLRDQWADGPVTYLGLTTVGFPNFFTVTGPQSPSVLANMAVAIEQHVEWITDTIAATAKDGFASIEPTPTAQAGWQQHTLDCSDMTLFPRTDSWYMGANVPGKPRVCLPYLGGVGEYTAACNEVAEQGWLGFRRTGAGTDGGNEECNDGLIRELQPDVKMMLDTMAEMGLPPVESMSPVDARAFMEASAAMSPPGPEVGEVVDGVFPGAAGDLDYRLYRPTSDGPHPVVLYFHGGGWVLGSHTSDDALCRDLCDRTGAVILSVDYRHAPEHQFPAPVDDAWAALGWVAGAATELDLDLDRLVVAGWSAGANLAAVLAQMARDEGGPEIAGQLLITPVVDCDMSRSSYQENAEGYILTKGLMEWFWDHYCPVEDRTSPKASPLHGDLAGLPPAVVVTCQFDPLRDEGGAYVEALRSAGVDAVHLPQRGQTHTSLGAVNALISPVGSRAEIADALSAFLSPTPAKI